MQEGGAAIDVVRWRKLKLAETSAHAIQQPVWVFICTAPARAASDPEHSMNLKSYTPKTGSCGKRSHKKDLRNPNANITLFFRAALCICS